MPFPFCFDCLSARLAFAPDLRGSFVLPIFTAFLIWTFFIASEINVRRDCEATHFGSLTLVGI
jgi:hypothetical protein